MPDQKRKEFRNLIDKYLNGTATPEEQNTLDKYFLLFRDEPEYSRLLDNEQLAGLEQRIESGLFDRIQKQQKITKLWPRIVAAASIILCLSIGGYYIFHEQAQQQTAHNHIHNDIAPGSNKAILTLSNGRQIILTDAQNGTIAKEGSQLVKKSVNGTVSYEGVGTTEKDKPLTYNTITTPRGGQWPLVLPDGTKVMLDAASSIKYPVSFADNERKVEITGQAYFEVVHNAAKPFRVVTKGQVIEDIGTKFNISAYDDEPVIKTTLLEGAVKVSASNSTPGLILKPGQQTELQNNKLTVSEVNTEEAIAWKNGYFNLNNENIESIMRKLSRWYDIEVEYKGDIPDMTLSGEIARNTPFLRVLKVLEDANFHFTMDGKKIIVTP